MKQPVQKRTAKRTAPFIHQGSSTPAIMWSVVACLAPILLVQGWLLSPVYLVNHLVVIVAALVCECACVALRKQPAQSAKRVALDGSIVVAAMILSYGMPPAAPVHVLVVAAVVMVLVKQMYGGLGMNLFNPAMTAYACALVMFPSVFSHWPHLLGLEIDAVSQATPLFTNSISDAEIELLLIVQSVVVAMGCAMLVLRLIKWHVPACLLAGFACVCILHALVQQQPVFDLLQLHFVSGALVFAAFFVVTDPVELPRTRASQMVYAVLVGVLIALIRLYGSYPEGVAFAVLLGNMTSPLMNEIEQRRRGVVIE